MPNLYEYLDYRLYLRDWLADKQVQNPRYSMRLAASKVGCDPAFLLRVMQGKKNPSAKLAFQIGQLLVLQGKAMEYFELLVQLSKAEGHVERSHLIERLTLMRKSKLRSLDAAQYAYFDKWYYTAIRELLDFYPFRGNFQDLARMVTPPIKPSEAQKAIEILMELGMVSKSADGLYERTDAVLTTGEGWRSVAIANYQLRLIDLAKEAFERFPEDERNFSTLTLSVSDPTYRRIVDNLIAFRREALELAKQDAAADRVWQFNFQIFPLSMSKTAVGKTDKTKTPSAKNEKGLRRET
jgi:uncharacterized protein (TIGR02147 family)